MTLFLRGSSALGALLLVASCGGDDLVLPEDGVPSAINIVSGNTQSGTVGAALASPLVIRVLDAAGRPVQGQQVTFAVISGGGSVAPTAPNTGADGQASATWTLGASAGVQQVQAKATGGAAPDNLLVLFNATGGASSAANLLEVSGDGQSGTAGSTLDDSLVVRATDAAANPVAGVGVTWTVTGGGSVSAATTTTGADGRTGVRHTLGVVAGAQAAVATSAGLTGSPITFAATATVGSAGRLAMNRQPSATAASGAAFAVQPRVQLQDANGNNVTTGGLAIGAELIGPPGSTLNGAATRSTVSGSGLATFTNLSITGPAGSYTLNFTGDNLTGVTSEPITLTAGAASRLVFSVQPSSAVAGAPIAPAVRVTIQDALGQTVPGATNAVTIGVTGNPAGVTLGGTKTVNAVNGVATFSTLEIDKAGTGYSLSASASGLTGAISNTFSITAGAATTLAASVNPPASTVAGGTVSPAPAVRATDASGNPVAGVAVTFAVVNGGSVSGESQNTNAAGIATVGSWTIGPTAGTLYQMRASASGLNGSPVTFSTTATAGSAGQLTIETQPAPTAQSGVALSPQPSVQLRDAIGNPVPTGGIEITATIESGPGGTLTNSTATTNTAGRATFSGLAITGSSGTYTLNFFGNDITGVFSNDIVLGSGAASKLGIAVQPSSSVQNGVDFPAQPVIQLQDATGNPVGTPGVTVTAALQPSAGATLGGDVTATTNSDGVATFSDLRITGDLSNRTLRFTAPLLTGVTSSTVSVTPGPASGTQSTLGAAPASFTAGDPAGSTITVTARDGSGNLIVGASVTPSSTGNGAFAPVSNTTSGAGTAAFTYTNTLAGTKTISADVDGVPLTQTVNVTVIPAGAASAQSALLLDPSTIVAGGAGSTISVTARDQFNNLISGATITIEATGSNVGLPASGSSDSDGVYSILVASSEAGDKTVTATVGGQALPTQTLTVSPAAPSESQSSITLEQPQVVAFGGPVSGSVQLRDAQGNPLTGLALTLTSLSPFGGPTPNAVTNSQGVAAFQYTGQYFGVDTLRVSTGSFSMQRLIQIVTAPVELSSSALYQAFPVLPPDPEPDQWTELRVDVSGPSGGVGGARVDFDVTAQDIVYMSPPIPRWTGPGGDDNHVELFVKSAKAQTYTVRASINGLDMGAVLPIRIRPRWPDGSQSSAVAVPAQMVVGASSTITVLLRDEFGNGVPDTQVSLSAPGAGVTFIQPASPTGDDGLAVGSFSASAAGLYPITVTWGADASLPQHPVVEVTD